MEKGPARSGAFFCLAALVAGSAFANGPDDGFALFAVVVQSMSCLCTEMRHVDHRSRIVGVQDQHIPRFKRLKTFAGFEHRKRAQQPERV